MLSIATNCMSEVSTDMPTGIALGYAQKVNNLKLDSVKIMTLPGQTATVKGLSCWVCHKKDTADMLNEHFRPYDKTLLTPEQMEIVDYSEIGASYNTDYDNMLHQGSLNEFHNDSEKTTQAQ